MEKGNNMGKYLLLIVIIAGVVIGGTTLFNLHKGSAKCPTSVTPEDFIGVDFQNENSVEAIFHDNNYETTVKESTEIDAQLYDEKTLEPLYKIYEFLLYTHNAFTEKYTQIDWAYYRSDQPGWVHYMIEKRDKYNAFFDYLRAIGADTVVADNFSNYAEYVGNYKCLKYKNCVFIDVGYMSDYECRCIGIGSYSGLQAKAK